MTVGRNDPCPCGSGKKFKKCCLTAPPRDPAKPDPASRFRFEPGSYGGPGRRFMPSAVCYEQASPGDWRDHFCLVNPTCLFDSEEEASDSAKADLSEASTAKNQAGSDGAFAMVLKNKGYIRVDDFQRAKD